MVSEFCRLILSYSATGLMGFSLFAFGLFFSCSFDFEFVVGSMFDLGNWVLVSVCGGYV